MTDLIDPKNFGIDKLNLFPTQVLAFKNEDPDADKMNRAIEEYVLEASKEQKDHTYSIAGNGWHSDCNLTDLDYLWSDKLTELIITAITAYAADGQAPKEWDLESWAVLINNGGYSNYHTHPGWFMSGVYYVKVPEDISQEEARDIGGIIQIPDTRSGACGTNHEGGTWSMMPEEGCGLVFPSWMPHFVTPYRGDSYRISLSWNIAFR